MAHGRVPSPTTELKQAPHCVCEKLFQKHIYLDCRQAGAVETVIPSSGAHGPRPQSTDTPRRGSSVSPTDTRRGGETCAEAASSGELRRAQASSAPPWCTPFHLGEQVGHLGEDRVVVVPLEEEVLAWLGLG